MLFRSAVYRSGGSRISTSTRRWSGRPPTKSSARWPTIIHEEGVTFIPYQDSVPYISEVRKQREALQNIEISYLDNEYSPESPETCIEEVCDILEEYYIENTCTECIGLQSFSPNWYRDIKSKKDIDKIVQRLEDIQIIGEIPMKYWKFYSLQNKYYKP